jgi:hypothetical protein
MEGEGTMKNDLGLDVLVPRNLEPLKKKARKAKKE